MDITVVGCILSKSFHTTKFILLNLVKHRPDLINKYIVKGVMDIEWARFLLKLNQNFGGLRRQDMVTVMVNKKFIGNHVEFQEYLITHYDFTIDNCPLNYKQLVGTDIQNYYRNDELFDKLVPKTCEYFKQLCLDKSEGYSNSTVHRIDINNGFIQAGRILNQKQYLKKENHLVSHDRRGVLSLSSRHTHFNGPEFIISLRPNSWMNNKYVAFGHLVEGEKTLKMIERLSYAHKIFNHHLRIISCDVLLNYTLPIIKTRFETTLHSKTLYIHTHGTLGTEQIPFIADFQYMKSIVQTIVSNVLRKIEYFSMYQNTMKQENDSENLKDGDFVSIPHILTSMDATKEKFTPTKFGLYSNVDINDDLRTAIPELRADRTMLLKSKNTDTREMAIKAYGIHLPTNHKDYWKYKQIYESIDK